MPWSGRSFTTCLCRAAVLRHAFVGTQFYDMPLSGRSFTTCTGLEAVLRHALVANIGHISANQRFKHTNMVNHISVKTILFPSKKCQMRCFQFLVELPVPLQVTGVSGTLNCFAFCLYHSGNYTVSFLDLKGATLYLQDLIWCVCRFQLFL